MYKIPIRTKLRGLFLLACFTCAPGCSFGTTDQLSGQINAAIGAIDDFNRIVDRTPDKLRVAGEAIIKTAKIESVDLLQYEGRNFVASSLGDLQASVGGTVSHTERKMAAYLGALKKALEEALPKVKASKSKEKAIELLKNLVVVVPPLDPVVNITSPKVVLHDLLVSHDGKELKRTLVASRVELNGFDLQRPTDEKKTFEATVIRADGAAEPISAAIDASTPFLANLMLANYVPRAGDRKIAIAWGGQAIAGIPIEEKRTVLPKPAPKIVAIVLAVNTFNDDKDLELRHVFTVHKPGDDRGAISVGDGEVWPDHSHRSFRIPLTSPIEVEKRLEYALHVAYHSRRGDPRHIFSIDAQYELSDGTLQPWLANTGAFEMGHHDNGRRPERVTRCFQANR